MQQQEETRKSMQNVQARCDAKYNGRRKDIERPGLVKNANAASKEVESDSTTLNPLVKQDTSNLWK